MNVHFIGLCGIGMSATALLVRKAGHTVTGSDASCYGPPAEVLSKAGFVPRFGYTPENIPKNVDQFVIGRNAKLTPEENAEVRAAHASGKPIVSFPEMLATLTEGRLNTIVAGSYGKSTVTSLIAHILTHAGKDVGYFIGGEPSPGPHSLPSPAHMGTDPLFILEGDEYPSAHDDPRAKFLHLHPRDLVLTAIVHDHVNVYPTFRDYQQPFRELLKLIPDDGRVFACADEVGARELAEASGKKTILYGLEDGIYRGTEMTYGSATTFTLLKDELPVATLETSMLGMHNLQNIVAASAYVLERNLVSPEDLRAAVRDFAGVRRRLDNLAPTSSVPVFEGFGSSYEKARSAIDALLLHFPAHPLVIVFEPHTFGWRNRANLDWYDTAFAGAQTVYIAPPETQGATTHDQLTYAEIMGRVSASGIDARPYDPTNVGACVSELEEGQTVLVLTSGDLEGSLPEFAEKTRERFS